MNKSDLIKAVQERNALHTSIDVETSINLILDFISSTLTSSNRLEVRGFGTFSVRERKKRLARNPKTGKSISVRNKYHPYFRASKSLKEVVNN
tara:strand:- start:19 stop:297 length:279 start_codon:yes stop_codon:yes gene_type:complete